MNLGSTGASSGGEVSVRSAESTPVGTGAGGRAALRASFADRADDLTSRCAMR
jgi:hypothetical protein